MKLYAHYVFSLGLTVALFSALSSALASPFPQELLIPALVMLLVLSILTNRLIDFLGHELRGGYVSRSPRTHTWARAGILGTVIACAVAVAFPLLYAAMINGDATIHDAFVLPYYLKIFLAYFPFLGFMGGEAHVFLDAFTERGVFRKRRGKWQRQAWAHFGYDSPVANGIASVAGVVMLAVGVIYLL